MDTLIFPFTDEDTENQSNFARAAKPALRRRPPRNCQQQRTSNQSAVLGVWLVPMNMCPSRRPAGSILPSLHCLLVVIFTVLPSEASGLWCPGAREKLPILRRKSVSLFWNEGRQEGGRSNIPSEGRKMLSIMRHCPLDKTVPWVLPTEALSPSTTDGRFQSL